MIQYTLESTMSLSLTDDSFDAYINTNWLIQVKCDEQVLLGIFHFFRKETSQGLSRERKAGARQLTLEEGRGERIGI